MRSRSIEIYWSLLLAASASVACGPKKPAPATTDPKVCAPVGAVAASAGAAAFGSAGPPAGRATTPAATAPAVPARLYVDISTDMRGFVPPRPDRGALRNVVLGIEKAVSNVVSTGPERCTLGTRVQLVCEKKEDAGAAGDAGVPAGEPRRCHWVPVGEPVSCAAQPPVDFGAPAVFSADSSRADVVLVRRPRPTKFDPQHPPAPDPLDEARITVLVLSGLAPGARLANDDPASGCRQGISPGCVAGALRQRVREGYGVWLTTVMLRFDGTFGSSAPMNKLYVEEAVRHVESIQQISDGEGARFPALRFGPQRTPPPRPRQDGDLGLTLFEYHGVRPVVLLTLSRDVELGRRVQHNLVEALRSDAALVLPPLRTDRIVNAVELAPLGPSSYSVAKAEKAPPGPQGQGAIDPAALQEFRVGASTADADGLVVDVVCGTKGQGWLTVQVGARPDPAGLPPYVHEETELAGPQGREALPANVGVAKTGASATEHRVFTACQGLPPRPGAWGLQYALTRTLTFNEAASGGAFWNEESAEKDYAMPERVYGLRDLAMAVTKEAIIPRAPAGRLCLRVQRVQ